MLLLTSVQNKVSFAHYFCAYPKALSGGPTPIPVKADSMNRETAHPAISRQHLLTHLAE
jgi:hypothetical protein